jgi:hypothetical protein
LPCVPGVHPLARYCSRCSRLGEPVAAPGAPDLAPQLRL